MPDASSSHLLSTLASTHVVIIGMGLMGASLGYDLRGHCRRVTGVVRRPEAVAETEASGCVDDATLDAAAAVSQADLVILATPVRTILRQIAELGPLMKPGAVLLDMGSAKTEICRALAALPEHVQPVGGHPMCGKETAGLAAAEPGLYAGCTFVLCPLPRTAPAALTLAQELVGFIRARALLLEPARHDHLVAAISHLPYLSASALVAYVMAVANDDPVVWNVAASGFRDSSRVAASDVKMLTDILLTNRLAVLEAIDAFLAQLTTLRAMVAGEEEKMLVERLSAIAQARRSWEIERKSY
ncbi:MAG: prephenate dehydrogenase/arogenate dehydrogenase family protein [Clostridia bacterium]|nr:MAG: prephenate dehydrogenase/arogenate dehydrogenase family protein [Clostridia bacterium]